MPYLRCPLCRTLAEARWRAADRLWQFTCPTCGEYQIDNGVFQKFEREASAVVDARHRLSIRAALASSEGTALVIREDNWQELAKT